MSTQPGHASNRASGNPNAMMNTHGQGGRPRTMILGMATVAAGLGMFWLLQFKKQDRSNSSPDPADMPTWQFRHAQQVPQFSDRVSSSGGTATNVRNSKEPTQYKTTTTADVKDTPSGGGAGSSQKAQDTGTDVRGSGGSSANSMDPRGKDNHAPKRGDDTNDRGVVASILTSLHGDPKKGTQNENGHVGEPAPTPRMNDRGGVYTKSSDFVDGYRRD